MQDIQTVWQRIQEAKKKQKELKSIYKDALATSMEYEDINTKLKTLKEKKKQVENTTKEQFASELTKLDDLKIDIASDTELISDIAMTQLMKGESIAIKDEYDNEYEPIFKVNFKKVG